MKSSLNITHRFTSAIITSAALLVGSAAWAGPSDHSQVIDSIGFQVVEDASTQSGPTLGFRRWGSPQSGWEAGISLRLENDGDNTNFGIGGMYGYLAEITTHEHIVVFFEPSAGLYVFVPQDQDALFSFNVRASLGAEIQLGMIGLSTVALTTKLSAGFDLNNNGDSTAIQLGTVGSVNGSIDGLLTGTVGFVVYFGGSGRAAQDVEFHDDQTDI